jgi:hypothetical protein
MGWTAGSYGDVLAGGEPTIVNQVPVPMTIEIDLPRGNHVQITGPDVPRLNPREIEYMLRYALERQS